MNMFKSNLSYSTCLFSFYSRYYLHLHEVTGVFPTGKVSKTMQFSFLIEFNYFLIPLYQHPMLFSPTFKKKSTLPTCENSVFVLV
jgi:hypothetical protein